MESLDKDRKTLVLKDALKDDFRHSELSTTNLTQQMNVEDYLEYAEVDVYLKDVVRHVLNARDDNPVGLMNQYFQEVVNYNHVTGREFEFVTATQRNRRAFAILFDTMYCELEDNEDISILDFHHLLIKICPDFPLEFVQQLAAPLVATLLPAAGEEEEVSPIPNPALPLGRLRQAFVIAFYYAGYLGKVRSIFADEVDTTTFKAKTAAAKQNKSGNVEAILGSLPAPTEQITTRLQTLESNSDKYKYRQIPFAVVNAKIEALVSDTLTFRQFLVSVFETKEIYDALITKPEQDSRASRIESACALLGLDEDRANEEAESDANENTTRAKKSSKKKR
mmetsp:Transcript_5849/g.7727  ORF Transcript_5849/g.7727 Transcript_5849/m.7727 type:complete len:337 (+) Transcript_5849:222-1232(+)